MMPFDPMPGPPAQGQDYIVLDEWSTRARRRRRMHAHRDPSLGRLRPRSVERATIAPAPAERSLAAVVAVRVAQGAIIAALAVAVIVALIVRFG